jgi:hypothetical protein
MVAAVEAGEAGHPDARRQGGDAVLGRAEPLGADVEQGAVRGPAGQGAAAHPPAGLQHGDVQPGPDQQPGRAQPGQPGTDHHHVGARLLRSQLTHRPIDSDSDRSPTLPIHPYLAGNGAVPWPSPKRADRHRRDLHLPKPVTGEVVGTFALTSARADQQV